MRYLTVFISILLVCMIAALPAFAGSRRYVSDLVESWSEHAEQEGLEVFFTDVDRISRDHSISYIFDLEPGYYKFIAEGGEDIEDLDMYVYDEGGFDLDSDTLENDYPICEIELDSHAEIEVEIVVYSFYERHHQDHFAFVAATEPSDLSDGYADVEVGDVMQYWIDWADDSGYEVLYSNTGSLSRDRSEYYEFNLSAGSYHVYAESMLEADDIDMYIYDEDGVEIESDTLTDNFPICSFDLRNPEAVEIEIVPYTLERDRSTDFAIVIAAEGSGSIIDEVTAGRDYPEGISDREDYDYIENLMGEYMEMVEQQGYEMIYDEIDLVDEYDTSVVPITLGRGDYIVYAEGGLRIADLDLRVYDEDGYIVSEDTLTDNMPVCEFSTYQSESFEIEIEPYEMEPGRDAGYYLLVIVRD